MGPLSNTLDLISQVGKIGDIDTDDAENMRKAINGTKSITERAKKSLFIYPVIHSPGMCDIETAMKINKFLEIQYGVFTLLTVGLDPKIENGSIGSYLNSISTESYDENDKSTEALIGLSKQERNDALKLLDEKKKDLINGIEKYYSTIMKKVSAVIKTEKISSDTVTVLHKTDKDFNTYVNETINKEFEKIHKEKKLFNNSKKHILLDLIKFDDGKTKLERISTYVKTSENDTRLEDYLNSKVVKNINSVLESLDDIDNLYNVYTNAAEFNDGKVHFYIGIYINLKDFLKKKGFNKNNKSEENYEVEFNKETNGMESEIWFNEFKTENKDFFNEYTRSAEADRMEIGNRIAYGTDVDKEIETGFVGELKMDALTKKLRNANPTLISLQLYIKGVANPVSVPIALKTNPHFVNSEDLASLLDAAIEDKRIINRFIKLSSGEISFFRDFLFNLDRVKRDQKLYAKFGQHPWYQQFIQKKESNLFKRFAIIFSTLTNKFKGLVSGLSSSLPTASIVITTDELERAAKMKYGFLVKNEKILWQILNRLSLLCICIYNPEVEMCAFYFNGFKKPMLVPISEMKSDNSDANAEMAKLMNTMLKRGIM